MIKEFPKMLTLWHKMRLLTAVLNLSNIFVQFVKYFLKLFKHFWSCQTFGSKMAFSSLLAVAFKSIKTSLISKWTQRECQNSWKTIKCDKTQQIEDKLRFEITRVVTPRERAITMRMMNKCWFDEEKAEKKRTLEILPVVGVHRVR